MQQAEGDPHERAMPSHNLANCQCWPARISPDESVGGAAEETKRRAGRPLATEPGGRRSSVRGQSRTEHVVLVSLSPPPCAACLYRRPARLHTDVAFLVASRRD